MRSRIPTNATLGGALLLALALAAGACGGDDEDAGDGDSTETTSPEAEDETVFDLEIGDCLAADPTGEQPVSEVPTVECAEPHSSEVFHTVEIDASELPSEAEVEGIVQDECFVEFESFVGVSYEQSALEVIWLQPTAESWELGDRELVCMVTDPAGQSTGTLEGASR